MIILALLYLTVIVGVIGFTLASIEERLSEIRDELRKQREHSQA